ncbi:endonuclease domain-containing protein [Microbacterium sp. NPDC087868]|uniref:endonuclease domain-containing protein n=1 Tax=Microbacterium sp. NPDC087868 TaxID=3364195 RepID=UPI00384EEE95
MLDAGAAENHRVRRSNPLPRSLPDSFGVRAAAERGVGRSRRDGVDLERPFHGIRSRSTPSTLKEQVAAYLPRLRPRHRFVGRTAAHLWGLPLSHDWSAADPVEVAVPQECTPPRTRGVVGRRLVEERARTWRLDGASVVDPIATVFTCARMLGIDELTVLLDALLTSAENYPGRVAGRPLLTHDDIAARLDEWGPFAGCTRVRAALRAAREGVESPKETETRLLIARAGLPEPSVQFEVLEDGRLIARIDLAYPDLKIAIEYEGDGHRTDRHQWRRDIQRQRDLEDRGWTVIRLTELDLQSPTSVIMRIRRAIAAAKRH